MIAFIFILLCIANDHSVIWLMLVNCCNHCLCINIFFILCVKYDIYLVY